MSVDIKLGATMFFYFTTRAFATGIPTVLAGSPVLSVMESDGSAITAGVSVDVDRGSVVGLNMGTVVATGGNGFVTDRSYSLYISTGTVGGVSVVGEVVAEFTVELSAAFLDLDNGTDGLTALAADIAAAQTDLDTLTAASGEPAQGAPPESATDSVKIAWLYKVLTNEKVVTATLMQIKNRAASVVDHKRVVDDDGTTYTEDTIISGP